MNNARLALVTCSGDAKARILPFVDGSTGLHIADMRLRGLSANTVTLRRTVLGLVVRYTGKPLLDIDRDDLDRWQRSIADLAPETRLSYVSAVRSFYRWATDAQLVDEDPSARLIVPKVVRGLPHPVSERNLEWVLANAPDPLRVWFELAAYAGPRAAEIATLERADVLDDRDVPALRLRGKGGKERMVPLAPRPLRSLRQYGMPWRGRLFRNPDGTPVSAHGVSQRCNRWLHRHGLPDTLHGFRHRFATQLYEVSDHDLLLVQQLLGHASPKTTTVYTLVNARKGAAAVARIDRPLLRPVEETGS
jgi:site-specific recombinase XerD